MWNSCNANMFWTVSRLLQMLCVLCVLIHLRVKLVQLFKILFRCESGHLQYLLCLCAMVMQILFCTAWLVLMCGACALGVPIGRRRHHTCGGRVVSPLFWMSLVNDACQTAFHLLCDSTRRRYANKHVTLVRTKMTIIIKTQVVPPLL